MRTLLEQLSNYSFFKIEFVLWNGERPEGSVGMGESSLRIGIYKTEWGEDGWSRVVWVEIFCLFRGYLFFPSEVFRVEEGRSRFVWNVGNLLLKYTVIPEYSTAFTYCHEILKYAVIREPTYSMEQSPSWEAKRPCKHFITRCVFAVRSF